MGAYNKYVKQIMDDLNTKFKYFTKKGENTWLIQSNQNSLMEAFFVDILDNGYIIMSGDYGGVMIRPGCPYTRLIGWMANATTLSYFAEKVCFANRYHICKEHSEKKAEKNIQEIKEIFLEDLEDEEKQQKEKEFDEFIEYRSVELEHTYRSLLDDLSHEYNLYDLHEFDSRDYTYQLKWQHKCLIFWANKVLEGIFGTTQNNIEVRSADSSQN